MACYWIEKLEIKVPFVDPVKLACERIDQLGEFRALQILEQAEKQIQAWRRKQSVDTPR